MWPYPWTHVGTPSHLGHMDRVAATMPSQAHAGAAQEAPDIGQWEGQDVPLVRPSSCNVKGGIPSSRRYLPPTSLSPPCPSVPLRRPALPAYPLRTRWVGVGGTVGLGGLTWCIFPAGRRELGSFWGRVARVVCVPLGSCSPRCARSVCSVVCTVSWAPWLLFKGVHALCVVVRVRCPGPPGSCSPVCTLCVWCCQCTCVY